MNRNKPKLGGGGAVGIERYPKPMRNPLQNMLPEAQSTLPGWHELDVGSAQLRVGNQGSFQKFGIGYLVYRKAFPSGSMLL